MAIQKIQKTKKKICASVAKPKSQNSKIKNLRQSVKSAPSAFQKKNPFQSVHLWQSQNFKIKNLRQSVKFAPSAFQKKSNLICASVAKQNPQNKKSAPICKIRSICVPKKNKKITAAVFIISDK